MSDIFTDTEIQESPESYNYDDYSSESYDDDNYSTESYDEGNCPPGHYISIAHGGKGHWDGDGMKKSAKGLLKVIRDTNGELVVKDGITWVELEQEDNLLVPVFKDGKFYNETSLTEIRKKLNEH